MKLKKRFGYLYIVFIVCFFLLVFVFFVKGNFQKQDINLTLYSNSTFKDRTIMIYMIGSNLESRASLATMDVKEIEQSGIDLDKNNVVIYAGGTKKWHNYFENNSIYELTDHGFELVSKGDNVSMGDSSSLSYFLTYVQENYNSDNYGLIFWDHGAGPIKGYGYDEVYDGDRLQLTEMKEAFESSGYSSKNKFEFVGFDTCLMASVEVAHILSDYSDYMIASQDLEPEYGWDYSFMSQIDSNIDTFEIGKTIIDYTDSFYKDSSNFDNPKRKFDVTLSMIDLTKVDKLEQYLNDLFLNVDVTLFHNNYSEVVSQITKAHPFGYYGFESSYDLVDLHGIMEQLGDEYSEQTLGIQQILNEMVIYQKSNVDGANGISIYYPYYTKNNISEYLGVYNSLDFAHEYTEFLFNYSKLLLGNSLFDISLNIRSLLPSYSSSNQSMQVVLDKDIIEHYNKASYVIMKKMNDGKYVPVYKSSDVVFNEDGVLSSYMHKKQLNVSTSNGDSLISNMIEYSKTDDSVIYNIPITLYQYEDNGVDIKLIENAYIKLLVDSENQNGSVVNIVPMSHIEQSSSMKMKIDLKEWDYIEFLNYEYEIYDKKDNLKINWIDSYKTNTLKISPSEEYKLEYMEFDEENEYYGLFEVEDTKGNIYYTNLVKID